MALKRKSHHKGVSRRRVISAAAGLAAASVLTPVLRAPAIAQGIRKVKYTLPWLAQGSTAYAFMANGFLKQHGIELEVSRGFGSLAAAQALAGGQFEYGSISALPALLSISKGLPLVNIGVVSYDDTMGVAVPAGSGIDSPAALKGKRIGGVPTSGEFPFFPAYIKRAGLSMSDVEVVHLDVRVLERALMEKQVDATMGIALSSVPVLLSRKFPAKFMLFSTAGVKTYGSVITCRTETLQKEPGLCAAVVDGILQATKFMLLNPQEAAERFLKQFPEILLNPAGREHTRIGMGLHNLNAGSTRSMRGKVGLGYADPEVYAYMIDLIMTYAASPQTKRPVADQAFTNQFVGKITLTAEEWAKVDKMNAEWATVLA